jgi:hypothetical protein
MPTKEEIRKAAAAHQLQFTDAQLDQLAREQHVSLDSVPGSVQAQANAGGGGALAAAEECCPSGSIGVGHKPRFCFKLSPPSVSICAG